MTCARTPNALQVKSANTDPIDDEQLWSLLDVAYVSAGFTDPERAKVVFQPASVRARGELLHISNDDAQLLGMLILVRATASGRRFAVPGECELHLLATAPEARRCGVGRMLVSTAIELARREGHRKVLLWTQPAMTAAQHLYSALGFLRTPTRDFETLGQAFLFYELRLGPA